ncbi:MAG: OmpA family protein [Deltaproteobacteria bacterium]|nr:OmpA family protein [Deltaproteobacteria bacterium]
MAANGGYLVRPERDILGVGVGDAYVFGAGVNRDIGGGWSVGVEFQGQQFDSASYDRVRGNPMEILGALRKSWGSGVRASGGGGGGLGGGLGSPSYRVVAGIDYAPSCDTEANNGFLDVRVTDGGGNPLSATLSVVGPRAFKVITDDTGNYQAEVTPGTYSVTASADGHDAATSGAVVTERATATLTLVLDAVPAPAPASLTVNIVGAKTSEPVDGARLDVRDPQGAVSSAILGSGTWQRELDAGSYHLTASKSGLVSAERDVQLAAGASENVTIALAKEPVSFGMIHFDFDSNEIVYPYQQTIANAAEIVRKLKAEGETVRLMVSGHASPEGTDERNMLLSERRAAVVKAALVALGVGADSIETAAYGDSRPLNANQTNDERAENRRVEIRWVE